MIRTPLVAALTIALMSGTAMAQPANSPPANLNQSARTAPDYDDQSAPPSGSYAQNYGPDGPGPGYDAPEPPAAGKNAAGTAQAAQNDQRSRDMFCRRDAAARVGYTTPGEAAHDAQVSGSVGGTLGGAALGAIIGGASGHAGAGAAIGAGAGLLAGTAIGADNADHAARDVQADYAHAYYACMGEADAGYQGAPPPGYAGDYPPGYAYGYGPYPYYPYYYGPAVGIGFYGHYGWRGGYGWHGGYRGGWRR